MTLDKINIERDWDTNWNLTEMVVTLNIKVGDDINEDATSADALYYLICALGKCDNKHHTNLNIADEMQVLSRLDATIDKLLQMKSEIEKSENKENNADKE